MEAAPSTVFSASAANIRGTEPSAVAWGAIIAGAVAAIAASIVLLTLGAGLGLTAVSPWNAGDVPAKALGVAAVIWLIVVQWFSAALGGFLTGRLRVRWLNLHHDEVYFRDTAHGFLAWALAIALVALVATSMTAGVVGGAARGAASGAAQGAASTTGYYTDSLFRSDASGQGVKPINITPSPSNEEARAETTRIFARSLRDDMDPSDRTYLAQLVANRTGLNRDEAQQRVDEVIAKAKQAADTARKAAASVAIATALSLAIGAFIAAVAAGIGGKERDE